ncbi:replication-associated recombination protein A, partial [Akkermansiaceae bacterium]|nr:replication-associated recombination protein A [Akkermansiaceae bacterium]
MDSLFIPEDSPASEGSPRSNEPLAARMRPNSLEEIAGQQHILAEGKLLRRAIEADRFTSLIFYGPPG